MFPLLYHAHHSRHPEDLPFWLDLAAHSNGPVLELGCGSGRVLLHLAREGYTVFGLDNDYDMLNYLRQSLPYVLPGDKASRAHIFQADFTHLHLEQLFALIIMPCNTYSTLPSQTRLACLATIGRTLQPLGRFVFSMPNPVLLQRLPARSAAQVEEIFRHPLSGEPVQVSSAWQRDRQLFTITWHYDHLLPDGQVERLSVQSKQQLISLRNYLDELDNAGFSRFTIYGDYDLSPYTEESPHAIIISQV